MARKVTQAEFVDRAQAVHGQRYDYSHAVYTGRKNKAVIKCSEHGNFEQTPDAHMRGAGCPECARFIMGSHQRGTQAQFIVKAQAVHGQRYDYSQVKYISGTEKVVIVCPKHGVFEQTPVNHAYGKGCRRCGILASGATQKKDRASWLSKAQAVHGDRYDYSRVVYVNSATKVLIRCPEHGDFEQTPNSHTSGHGCPACGDYAKGLYQADTHTQFIEKAQAVHGDRYDYSRVVYARADSKVTIICPEHGDFEQTPVSHTQGYGCRCCAKERVAQMAKSTWIERAAGRVCILYFLRFSGPEEVFYKIGITFLSIKKRYASKASLSGYKYEVLAKHQSPNAAAVYDWEQSILETFAYLRYRPKIRFDGETECFTSCEEILNIFPL